MDLSSLSQSVTKEDIKKSMSASKSIFWKFTSNSGALGSVVLGVAIFSIIVVAALQGGNVGVSSLAFGVLIIIVGAVVSSFYFIYRQSLRVEVETALRVQILAKTNGWTYRDHAIDTQKSGILFTAGHGYNFMNIVTAPDFQVGQCKFITGSGRSAQERRYGFIAIPLKRQLPNMLLDSRSNNLRAFGMELSNLPETLNKNQVVSLEGDFDKYYTLYAPKEYDVDVRYVFTPDLMQALISESDSIDIEIVDNTMLVYLGKYNIGTVEFWQRVDRFINLVVDKIQRQTQNYTDDKSLEVGAIAPQGRKLHRGVSVVSIVFIVVVMLLQILDFWNKSH